MTEKLMDEEKQIFENFNVEIKETPNLFISNKCPLDSKNQKYIKFKYQLGSSKKIKKFDSSTREKLYNIKIYAIIIMMFYSIVFYDLLITYIFYPQMKLLIFFIIVYILGTLIQVSIIPKPMKYKSKIEFENDINKILNSYVIFKVNHKKKKKEATYQAKYTIDITGILNIPSGYNYATIKAVQLYGKNDLNTFIKNFNEVYKSANVDYKMIYENEEVNFDSSAIYNISDKNDLYSINCYTTIFSLLLLQWIKALYYYISTSKKCINIYLAKLITDNLSNTLTNFTVHGKKFQIKNYVIIPTENNTEFDKDYEEYLRKKKEKEEREAKLKEEKEKRERERKKNTKVLSYFKNGRNFTIKVKKVYDTVYLKFDAYTKKRHVWYKSELGDYDPNVEERIVRKDKMTIYYPEGYDIRIEVIRGLYAYTVTIGDEYTENFEYYYD